MFKIGDVVDGPGTRKRGKVVHLYGGKPDASEDCPLPIIVEWPDGARVPYSANELTLNNEPKVGDHVGFIHWETSEEHTGILLERYRVTMEPGDEYGVVEIDNPPEGFRTMSPAFHRLYKI